MSLPTLGMPFLLEKFHADLVDTLVEADLNPDLPCGLSDDRVTRLPDNNQGIDLRHFTTQAASIAAEN